MLSDDRKRVKNIKGKTLGRTLNAHAEMPLSEVVMYLSGFVIMQNKRKMMSIVANIFVVS